MTPVLKICFARTGTRAKKNTVLLTGREIRYVCWKYSYLLRGRGSLFVRCFRMLGLVVDLYVFS
jgi:hypothetical protein